jgi:ClpP class serine protease
LQLEIHETFIDLVKGRRGARLKDDPELFTGLFWTAKKGLELGLVDGLGDMRSVLKDRFGARTRLKLISQPRGLFGRRALFGMGGGEGLSAEGFAERAAAGLLAAIEDRALWNRFGL